MSLPSIIKSLEESSIKGVYLIDASLSKELVIDGGLLPNIQVDGMIKIRIDFRIVDHNIMKKLVSLTKIGFFLNHNVQKGDTEGVITVSASKLLINDSKTLFK